MKDLFILLLLWCLYFSATYKQGVSTSDLVFINATSQAWSGGAAGSGHGVNYNFYFIKKTKQVSCDSAWVDGYVLPVVTTIKGDTVHLSTTEYFRGQIGQHSDMSYNITPKKESAPVTDKSSAVVIRYTTGKSKKFATVPTVTRLKPLNYP